MKKKINKKLIHYNLTLHSLMNFISALRINAEGLYRMLYYKVEDESSKVSDISAFENF